MEHMSKVSNIINSLTKDEDRRQDLWVHYLSGNQVSSFSAYMVALDDKDDLQIKLTKLLCDPPSNRFHQLLTHFSEVERSIVCLLALGLSIQQISRYKDISEIRIYQVIFNIRQNRCWKELYGTKETSKR